jgi:hypothetical protein
MKNKLLTYGLIALVIATGIATQAILRHSNAKIEPGESLSQHHTSNDNNSHGGHSTTGIDQNQDSEDKKHEGHHPTTQDLTIEAKLSVSKTIKPDIPVDLAIDVLGNNGESITKFDIFQEKLMHLIIVSNNLEFFNHIHPNYQENGRFEVKTVFPKSGDYTIFSDYKPSGQQERVSIMQTQVEGDNFSPPIVDLSTAKTIENTKVNLLFSQPKLPTDREVTLTFDLKETSNNKPIFDLQPYLGEKGHLVIIKLSSPLTQADYIHAHALKDVLSDKIQFIANFPSPGKYKLWGQFNRNGKIVVADFWVNIIN